MSLLLPLRIFPAFCCQQLGTLGTKSRKPGSFRSEKETERDRMRKHQITHLRKKLTDKQTNRSSEEGVKMYLGVLRTQEWGRCCFAVCVSHYIIYVCVYVIVVVWTTCHLYTEQYHPLLAAPLQGNVAQQINRLFECLFSGKSVIELD